MAWTPKSLFTKSINAAKTGIAQRREDAAANIERLKKDRAQEIEKERLEAAAEAERKALAPEDDFVKAEYGVPHCKFERTPTGFRASFNRAGLGTHTAFAATAGSARGAKGVAGVGTAAGTLVGLSAIGIYALAKKAGKGTVIEVTRTAVIINDKKMTRRDFGQFSVARTVTVPDRAAPLAVLGYQYGSRTFEFGGAWNQAEAIEVASALNHELRSAPMEGDENRMSPEALRAARPTDF